MLANWWHANEYIAMMMNWFIIVMQTCSSCWWQCYLVYFGSDRLTYDTGQHCSDHHVENDDDDYDDYDDNDEMT